MRKPFKRTGSQFFGPANIPRVAVCDISHPDFLRFLSILFVAFSGALESLYEFLGYY